MRCIFAEGGVKMALKSISSPDPSPIRSELYDLLNPKVGQMVSITTTAGGVEGVLETVSQSTATIRTVTGQTVYVVLNQVVSIAVA